MINREQAEIIVGAIRSHNSAIVYLAPLVGFYVTGISTLQYPEAVKPTKFPDKHAGPITQDLVATTLDNAVQLEALVDLLINKGVLDRSEVSKEIVKASKSFAERKRELHKRYFLGIMESLT